MDRWLASTSGAPVPESPASVTRVLILGVYLASRRNSIEHLVERFADVTPGFEIQQRWAAIQGVPPSPAVSAVTVWKSPELVPKFEAINRLLDSTDLYRFDFMIVCDDDIFLPRDFLRAFLGHQRSHDLAAAQPARTWNSYFDHGIVLRRPWWHVRETRFVECGPLVSFRRDAARLLMPFEHAENLWGLDLIWPAVLEERGLKMGIVDATPVDHSLRPQGSTYSKSQHEAAMHLLLAKTRHVPMAEAFTVIRGRRKPAASAPLSSS